MKLLLDTHILLWAMLDDARLSGAARSLLEDPENEITVSVISFYEIAIKASLGKSGISCSTAQIIDYVRQAAVSVLDLRPAHAITMETLPWHHRDPFDRILVSAALTEPARLVTHDQALAAYSSTIILV